MRQPSRPEDALQWFTSSYSGGSGTECVEAAFTAWGTAVRDSKRRERGVLTFTKAAWTPFVTDVRNRRAEPR
ncbi:DUF397 domain-containing protein [Streptomyces sp. JJ66]|uniref:DUF397 domain-containing protein n=1 Tax=Streptomyces sp. JJ66 TaxID=2803843 RepID=UPI001C559C30|nr:DUF397 domain-containing protein [Streptomyces sp. JJ66]MBW1604557.1 DUF397 domain-containing protein [Streptomyces sp. JJ66]